MWSALKALHDAAVSPDDVRKVELRACAHAAAALTQRLATRGGGAGGPAEREQLLPPSYIAHAQGLAFLFTSKGGLGLSFEHGWGCVIQRLGKRAVDAEGGGADGCLDGCVWSAPAFVRINNVGVGLTVGYDSLETVLVLPNRSHVSAFQRTDVDLTIDAGLVVGRNREVVDEETVDSPTLAGGALQRAPAPIPYSVGDGALFDLSLKGGICSADERMNWSVYGANATASEILEGQHAPPAEFAPLYAVLTAIASQHTAPFSTSGSRKALGKGRRRSGSPTTPLDGLPEVDSPTSSGGTEGAASPEPQVIDSKPLKCRQRSFSRSATPEAQPSSPVTFAGNDSFSAHPAAIAGAVAGRQTPVNPRPQPSSHLRRGVSPPAEAPEKRNS